MFSLHFQFIYIAILCRQSVRLYIQLWQVVSLCAVLRRASSALDVKLVARSIGPMATTLYFLVIYVGRRRIQYSRLHRLKPFSPKNKQTQLLWLLK